MTTTQKLIEGLAEKICDKTGYGSILHSNDIKPDIKEMVAKILEAEIEREEKTMLSLFVGEPESTWNRAKEDTITHLQSLLALLK